MNEDSRANELCRLLPWDTGFFGFPVATVDGGRLERSLAEQVDAWCRVRSVACVYLLLDPSIPSSSVCAEDAGYHLVDIRLTLEASTYPSDQAGIPPGCEVGAALPGDADTLAEIARMSFTASRFFADPRFPRESSAALYETWTARSLDGWADEVLVCRSGEAPLGFVTCHLDAERGRIGLVGVSKSARGRGVARALLASALEWFASHGRRTAQVVTQGRNVAAQRLYQGAGFRTTGVGLWYHKWFPAGAP